MTPGFILTIDGPAGVGKSTLAKRVASALGVAYLDTGAMFRTIGLGLARTVPSRDDLRKLTGAPLENALQEFHFTLEGSGEATTLLCNGQAVGVEVRTEEAGMTAAAIAVVPEVREFLKQAQQELGKRFSLVAEGRDMGTVVFPKAACKIFLDASPEVRALRRFRQLEELGSPTDLVVLTRQIEERDDQDRNRAIAPLVPADDAMRIDTSSLTIDDVFVAIVHEAEQRKESRGILL